MGTRTSRSLTAAERAKLALELRAKRYSFAEIAERCGYASRGAAHTAIQREIAKIPREAARELLALNLERLDHAERAISERVDTGDLKSIEVLLKIVAARLRFLGAAESSGDHGVSEMRDALAGFLGDVQRRAAEWDEAV